jgi:hypothetical protein
LSVGMQGLPNWTIFATAMALVALLPIKTFLYFYIATRFGLRARTSLFNAIALGNYSEFGLIVAALGVSQGFLDVDWLLIFAIAVSLSFAAAAPFSKYSEQTYQRYKNRLHRFQKSTLHPKDKILDTGQAKILIIGMGRVGAGAYKVLADERPGEVLGIELNEDRAEQLRSEGLFVEVADATDTDFWNQVHLSKPVEEMILLAMPNHMSNIFAAERINASGLDCKVFAVAKHETEVKELSKMGVPSFNLYSEAGESFGREALGTLAQKP